jgi:hypothetical protein
MFLGLERLDHCRANSRSRGEQSNSRCRGKQKPESIRRPQPCTGRLQFQLLPEIIRQTQRSIKWTNLKSNKVGSRCNDQPPTEINYRPLKIKFTQKSTPHLFKTHHSCFVPRTPHFQSRVPLSMDATCF